MLEDRFSPDLASMAGNLHELYVYFDGKFVLGNEAKISVWDHGFLYGDGIFEGIRLYDGKIFKLDEHIDRLFDSAKGIGLDIPLVREEIKQAILETVRRNRLKDAHIRPIVTRGVGKPGLDSRASVRPSLLILAYPFPPLLGEKPVKLITSSIRRKAPHSIDPRIKSLNYLDGVLAKIQASNAGADDAVMLDHSGFIAECSAENIFMVRDGKILTPTTVAALHGVTRATVIGLARSMGFEVEEKNLVVGDLYTSEEAFLTGTAVEITAVGEVDGRKIGNGERGPITSKLAEKYMKLVREEHVTSVYS